MRKNKNNSSICQTTTLLTLSNVSMDQSQEPFLKSRQHNQLIDKIRELQQILETTNREKFLLIKRQEQLLDVLAQKTNILDRINQPINRHSSIPDEIYDEQNQSVIDQEMVKTCKINEITESIKKRQGKTHHKFYSAIQSPTVSYSPNHIKEQITLNNYSKSKFYPSSTASNKTGFIRKQRDNYNQSKRSYETTEGDSINFKSIDDIWNEVGTNIKGHNQKKQKLIKSFL